MIFVVLHEIEARASKQGQKSKVYILKTTKNVKDIKARSDHQKEAGNIAIDL